MVTPDEIKKELRCRHNIGVETGEDRLNLDTLELIEQLQTENYKLRDALLNLQTYRLESDLKYIVENGLNQSNNQSNNSPDSSTQSRKTE